MNILDDIKVRVFGQSALPDRTGPHAVGTARLKVRAAGEHLKGNTIVVQLWYPMEGEPDGSPATAVSWLTQFLHPKWAPARHGTPSTLKRSTYPFIAYVPDAHGHHDDNTFTLANLASHGFILAAIDNPYRNGAIGAAVHAGDTHPRPNGVANPAAARYAHQVARGVKTASALLDALIALKPDDPDGVWANRIDLGQVGILGYAMGGAVAAETALADRRYSAAANLSGTMSNGIEKLVKTPYLLMLSDLSLPEKASVSARRTGETDDIAVKEKHYRHARAQAALPTSHIIEVAGTRRHHFSDRLIFPSRFSAGRSQLPAIKRTRAIIDSYTVAFFTTYLQSAPHPLMCVRHSPYPEVQFVAADNIAWALSEPAGRS